MAQEGQEEIVSEKITQDQVVAEVFNKFFTNIVPNLKISTDYGYDDDFIATDCQVINAAIKIRNHPSIIMIKKKKKMITALFILYFYKIINQCMSKSIFPSDLKLADVAPVYI